jgi:hypothetical protein
MAVGKVRIAVAMNEFGQWAAYGEYATGDDEMKQEAYGHVPLDSAIAFYFVEADIPLPLPQTVPGTVTPAAPARPRDQTTNEHTEPGTIPPGAAPGVSEPLRQGETLADYYQRTDPVK